LSAIENLKKCMPAAIDAAIIISKHNRRYFTGFESTDGLLFVTRTRAVLFVDSRYIEAAHSQAQGCEVVLLENRSKQLKLLASDCGIKTAGVEAYELPIADFERLKENLPEINVDGGNELSELINRLRMIKTDEEIKNIRQAQKITDAAFEHILAFIKPGVAERDLALEIEYFMKKNGATAPSFDLIVVSGENSSRPHGVPSERRLQNGDFITMDTGAIFNGYCSDMTRTVALGGVTSGMKHVYDTVLKAQLEAEKVVTSGVVCSEVDKISRDIIYNAGYKGCFGHGLGHSLGLEIHEEPRLSPQCEDVLAENMLMTVEPGIYLEGKFGVRIEDLVIVKKDGCEILTKSPKELMVL